MTSNAPNNYKDMAFEELMVELKNTLDILEKGDLSLENSMKSYEKGVTLVRFAEEKLKNMEGRMEEILSDGTIKDLHLPDLTVSDHDNS